jgi:hypothetical protein
MVSCGGTPPRRRQARSSKESSPRPPAHPSAIVEASQQGDRRSIQFLTRRMDTKGSRLELEDQADPAFLMRRDHRTGKKRTDRVTVARLTELDLTGANVHLRPDVAIEAGAVEGQLEIPLEETTELRFRPVSRDSSSLGTYPISPLPGISATRHFMVNCGGTPPRRCQTSTGIRSIQTLSGDLSAGSSTETTTRVLPGATETTTYPSASPRFKRPLGV